MKSHLSLGFKKSMKKSMKTSINLILFIINNLKRSDSSCQYKSKLITILITIEFFLFYCVCFYIINIFYTNDIFFPFKHIIIGVYYFILLILILLIYFKNSITCMKNIFF